jgi:crotonobetainyl-CoA:carnitine CoA-transferase CaiB-like acyl-CoA transferase
MEASRKPPLAGTRVIDIGQLVAGPMVASILGDFGARVIKVEGPRRPDPQRRLYQKDGIGLWARVENRNKEAIALDLKSDRGRELLEGLLADADVLVENFRPGVLERLGLAPDRLLAEVNAGLVICRVSGWGQTGPRRERRGYGRTGEAASGFSHLNGEANGPPMHSAVSLGDTVAALWGAYGVVLALRARDRDGTGQVVDVGLNEGLMRMIVHQVVVRDQLDRTLKRMGNQNPGVATVNMYETGDGKFFTVSNATPRTQQALIDLVGLGDDPRLGTVDGIEADRERFNAHLSAWMKERDIEEVDRLFEAAGAVGTPVWSAEEILAEPHLREREMILEVDDPDLGTIQMPGVVPKLSRTPGGVRSSGEELGASTDRVLTELLGLGAAELAELRDAGVV